MKKFFHAAISLILLSLIPAATLLGGPWQELTINTSDAQGVYFPVGQAICRVVNQTVESQGYRCKARSAYGSIANLAVLKNNLTYLAITKSSFQYQAALGVDDFCNPRPR